MGNRRTNIAAGVVALVIAASGAVVASAQERSPNDPGPTVEGLTQVQSEALEAIRSDAPIPVQDASGAIRGFVRDSVLTARDQRVSEQIETSFREREGPVDEEYDELFEALRILDPVAVVDGNDVVVGYWTHHFKEPEELDALVPEASATVARVPSPGPGS